MSLLRTYLPYIIAGKYEIINNLNKSLVGSKHTRHNTIIAVVVGAPKNAANRIHSDLLDLKVGKLVFDVTRA